LCNILVVARQNNQIIDSGDTEEVFIGLIEFLLADSFVLVNVETSHHLTCLLGSDLHVSAHLFEGAINECVKLLDL
jgi:hypothetical protein